VHLFNVVIIGKNCIFAFLNFPWLIDFIFVYCRVTKHILSFNKQLIIFIKIHWSLLLKDKNTRVKTQGGWTFQTRQGILISYYIYIRRPVPSTDQAIPSCFYFRISWILLEQLFFYFFLSPRVSAGPQKLQTLTASKTKYEKFGPKI
jgi:hypothetical protein